VGTVFLDRQLCIQRFTPAATRVINFIQSDIGRPVGHIVSNLVGYDSLVQDAQGVLDTLVFRKVEAQTQNGQWYLLRILPYRTLENVIEGVVITFVNITEQKQMQEALQESERNLNNAQRAARVGIWTWDLADDTFKWSDEMYRIFGVDQASYRPTPTGLADLAHPDDAHVMSAESLKRAASAKNYETEYRVIDQRTQEVKTIHLWGETIFDAGGTATRITGTLQDITRRVQAQEQAEYQALLLQSVADAVISTDLDFNVLGWNKAAEATYGWTRDQALGQQVNKFTRTEWPDEQEQEATRQLFEQGFWKGEIVQQRQDGARINVHTALSLIKDKDGNPIEVVAVNRKA
jgi:PAS domain S-box-containing protein